MPFGIFHRNAVISDADFERSAVYNEVFRSFGGFRSLHVRQNGTSGAFILSVCRPQRAPDYGAAEVAMLRDLLGPAGGPAAAAR